MGLVVWAIGLLRESAIPASKLAIYAEHLHQQGWNLQRYPNLWTVFTQIVKQSSPVTCEAEQGSQLQKMGLVQLTGFQANLACELFRPFFHKRLPQISG